ncbi:uncharacterized protein LOC120206612 [Hibiscus syriacus]|uniref:uncharacterized protein LOC120206612 n=1 Tax=Hibiscus syriacus TaxID=106335 RepID=UPI001922F230|nr:uncharacterized protein LOC120206612 [Hibiscus syriacus]
MVPGNKAAWPVISLIVRNLSPFPSVSLPTFSHPCRLLHETVAARCCLNPSSPPTSHRSTPSRFALTFDEIIPGRLPVCSCLRNPMLTLMELRLLHSLPWAVPCFKVEGHYLFQVKHSSM